MRSLMCKTNKQTIMELLNSYKNKEYSYTQMQECI